MANNRYSDYDPLEGVNNYDGNNANGADDYQRRAEQKASRTEKSLKTVFGLIIGVLVVLVVLLIAIFGIKNKISEKKEASGKDSSVSQEEKEGKDKKDKDVDAEKSYTTGVYSVSAAGSLRLREEHSMEGKHIMSVPSGTKLEINEIYCDEDAASEEEKYWGKTEYKGNTAWVCLAFMTKESDDSIVPDDENETTEALEGDETLPGSSEETTAALTEETTIASIDLGTTAPSESLSGTGTTSGAYKTGKYQYNGTDSKLHLRSNHSVSSDSIADIPSGESFEVTEIYTDESASSDSLKYWGRINYAGYDGWICLSVVDSAE